MEMAPVGQYTRHCPQLTHWVSTIFLLNAGITIASVPRYANPSAPIPWSSSQARTQSPQRIHLLGSRTIEGELSSISRISLVFLKRISLTPKRCASSWSTHSPLFTQVVQSLQCAARSSSTISFLYFLILPELV